MAKAPKLLMHLALLLCAACVFLLDVSDAHAQSRNCQNLSRTLAQIERSSGFRNSGGSADVRRLEREVQQTESRYVRDGCNAAAKRGERLSADCRAQARSVLRARETLEKARSRADSSNAIAQQREAVLQEMARFNCNAGSTASVNRNRGGNLFEQLFGGGAFGGSEEDEVGDGLATRGEDFRGYAGYNTVRTVCVRKADGFFWPVSYSTLVEYAPNDLTQCQAQCPGQDVDLYYYSNPGQEPEQMVNLAGAPYTSLPTAFAYRTAYDPANHCKPQVSYGGISLATLADGTNRAVIAYGEASFPMPLRDPRRTPAATVVQAVAVTYVDVPLPRPRPAAPGEAPKPVVVQQAANDTSRVVMFGDKRVRVVGPDTPYAPTAATGT
jgi:hypothetical protein